MVCCVLLNRTTRKQVDLVVEDLFSDYPTADDMAEARIPELREILRPLGFSTQRSQRLIAMSEEWRDIYEAGEVNVESVATLPGVGPYTLDAYRMLVLGDLTVTPDDKELRKWLSWRLSEEGS